LASSSVAEKDGWSELQAVAELKALVHLNLDRCSLVTDEGVWAVAELKALTYLSLFGCSLVTDQGVQAVAGLTNLTRLHLPFTRVTDAGLQHLTSLEELIDLSYSSEAAMEELGQQIPGLEIVQEGDYEESDEEDSDAELSD